MTVEPGERANEWVRLWNARDVEGVLRHYHDRVVFRSPLAVRVAGTPVLDGKAALRAYWTQAVSGLTTLHFALDHVLWDPDQRELAVIYDATLNERQLRGCELMRLDEAGLVVRGEALYGSI
jgi:SnoaL-like domain